MPIRGYARFVFTKIFSAILTIFVIICVNFVLFRIVPGDPIRLLFRDPRMTLEQMALLRQQFGLDLPIGEQFVAYLRQLFLYGNLGISIFQGRTVTEIILDRLPSTLLLIVTAVVIAIILGTILGAISGWKTGSKLDAFLVSNSLASYSIPAFCVSIVLLVVFSYHLGIFPLAGMATPASGLTGLAYVRDVAWHMVLPAIAVAIMYIGQYVLITRNAMQDVLDQDYIISARAKGVKESVILRRHALRNAILPVVTMTGINLAWAVAGSLQVEIVFSWPGVGRLMYEAILKRDYPVLQGLFLAFAVAVVLANLVVDLIYGRLDPRIKVKGD